MPSAMQFRPFFGLDGIPSPGPASGGIARRTSQPHQTVLNERILPQTKLMIIPIFLPIFKRFLENNDKIISIPSFYSKPILRARASEFGVRESETGVSQSSIGHM
jgi:hypothetical protein